MDCLHVFVQCSFTYLRFVTLASLLWSFHTWTYLCLFKVLLLIFILSHWFHSYDRFIHGLVTCELLFLCQFDLVTTFLTFLWCVAVMNYYFMYLKPTDAFVHTITIFTCFWLWLKVQTSYLNQDLKIVFLISSALKVSKQKKKNEYNSQILPS